MKVGVVGVGRVGAACALSLVVRGSARGGISGPDTGAGQGGGHRFALRRAALSRGRATRWRLGGSRRCRPSDDYCRGQ